MYTALVLGPGTVHSNYLVSLTTWVLSADRMSSGYARQRRNKFNKGCRSKSTTIVWTMTRSDANARLQVNTPQPHPRHRFQNAVQTKQAMPLVVEPISSTQLPPLAIRMTAR